MGPVTPGVQVESVCTLGTSHQSVCVWLWVYRQPSVTHAVNPHVREDECENAHECQHGALPQMCTYIRHVPMAHGLSHTTSHPMLESMPSQKIILLMLRISECEGRSLADVIMMQTTFIQTHFHTKLLKLLTTHTFKSCDLQLERLTLRYRPTTLKSCLEIAIASQLWSQD